MEEIKRVGQPGKDVQEGNCDESGLLLVLLVGWELQGSECAPQLLALY